MNFSRAKNNSYFQKLHDMFPTFPLDRDNRSRDLRSGPGGKYMGARSDACYPICWHSVVESLMLRHVIQRGTLVDHRYRHFVHLLDCFLMLCVTAGPSANNQPTRRRSLLIAINTFIPPLAGILRSFESSMFHYPRGLRTI